MRTLASVLSLSEPQPLNLHGKDNSSYLQGDCEDEMHVQYDIPFT